MPEENPVQITNKSFTAPEATSEALSAPERPLAQILAEVQADAQAQIYSFIP